MIASFVDRETELLWVDGVHRSIRSQPAVLRSALRRLMQLDTARRPEDMRHPPGNRLEKLEGGQGRWSVRVNDQWRICFRFEGSDAIDVEFADYH